MKPKKTIKGAECLFDLNLLKSGVAQFGRATHASLPHHLWGPNDITKSGSATRRRMMRRIGKLGIKSLEEFFRFQITNPNHQLTCGWSSTAKPMTLEQKKGKMIRSVDICSMWFPVEVGWYSAGHHANMKSKWPILDKLRQNQDH